MNDIEELSDPGKLWEGEELDMDDEELEKKMAEEYVMEYNGIKCPERFLNHLTPMEFEEMVNLFQDYDIDGSETIDVHEARKILHDMDMAHDLEKATELLSIVDEDGSGEIDFEEFCHFIIMIKRGDSRLEGFGKLLEGMSTSPLGSLEAQCKNRNLKFKFTTLEIREATSSQPPAHVVELEMFGIWHMLENGVTVQKKETRRIQGIGKNVREAKNNAASAAVIKLQAFMPGIKYAHGVIPDEWVEWIDENLLRGVETENILHILVTKGFHPHKNNAVMQRIGGWLAFNRFLKEYPDFELDERHINPSLANWITKVLNRGIDGYILWKVLEDRWIEIDRFHPHYAQKLKNNELGQILGKDGSRPKILDFWQACEDGDSDLVSMYCMCGQNVNEERIGRHDSMGRTPMMLAAMGNHVSCLRHLIKHNADVRLADRSGRTALHLGAKAGAREACEFIMENGGRIFEKDHMGNTALHLAALQNAASTVDFLAYKGQEFTRAITSDKTRVKPGVVFEELATEVWEDVQTIKLHLSETRRFEKSWLGFASKIFCERMDPSVQHMVAPTEHVDIVKDVLTRFDPRPETGVSISVGLARNLKWHKTIPGGHELSILLKYLFRQTAIDIPNNMDRSPLHMAAERNNVSSHEDTIYMLTDRHGCNCWLRDMHGNRPIDLLMRDPKLTVGPSSTCERENLIMDQVSSNYIVLCNIIIIQYLIFKI
jgi:hypothetical protein